MDRKRLSRRDFLHMSGLVTAGLGLAACTPPVQPAAPAPAAPAATQAPATGATPAPAAAAPAGKKTATAWISAGASAASLRKVVFDTYNAENTIGATVEVTEKAELTNIIYSALQAGAAPDIFLTNGPSFSVEPAKSGMLLDLTPFIDQYHWDKMFAPWSLDVGKVDGKLYSIASEVETIVLWYVENLFQEKGWQVPKTTDELVALCQTIADAKLIPFAGSAGSAANCVACNEWYFLQFTNSVAGGDKFYRALKGEIHWTDPAFVEAIDVLTNMIQKGYWMGSRDTFMATSFEEMHAAFGKGEAAMNMEGTWFYNGEANFFPKDGPNKWAIAPFPTKDGKPLYAIGTGSAWSGNANAKNPDVVGDFYNFFFSPKTQGKVFSQVKMTPAAVSLTAADMEGVDPRVAKVFEDMNKAFREGNYGYTTWTFFPPKANAYVYDNLERVWLGELKPADYLKNIDDLFQKELADGAVPPVPVR